MKKMISKLVLGLILAGLVNSCSASPSPNPPDSSSGISAAEEAERRADEAERRIAEAERREEEARQRAEEVRKLAEQNERRETIRTELSRLDTKHHNLSLRISEQEDSISSLRSNLITAEGNIKTHEAQVASHLKNNMMVAACVGFAGISLDEGNQYEQDLKDVAAAATVGCGLMLLDTSFRNQVLNMVDWMNQADTYNNNLVQQRNGIQFEIEKQVTDLGVEKAALADIDRTIQTRQFELEELDSL